jgi:hypothetical protein
MKRPQPGEAEAAGGLIPTCAIGQELAHPDNPPVQKPFLAVT